MPTYMFLNVINVIRA